mmetsp:Transcript_6813/g.10674  ORF Transcript_6813/g.10674 Transcript_6813/m.10674 type:complete len:421 (+) Transcript_6813:130-1392(+)
MASTNCLAVDIGGSLAKLVYFESNDKAIVDKSASPFFEEFANGHDVPPSWLEATDTVKRPLPIRKGVHLDAGRIHFLKFETRNITKCLRFIDRTLSETGRTTKASRVVFATGGGAYKYAKLFHEQCNITLKKVDEMESVITGLNFLLKNIEDESFMYLSALNKSNPKIYLPFGNPFPYLLVHIGSGVSILKVDSESSYERVSGTSLGGGTFLGLCQLLTNCTSFDDLLKLSVRGDNTRVDMLVGDIYGTDYTKIGLKSDTIASSFGKIIMRHQENSLWSLLKRCVRRTTAIWIDFFRAVPFIRRFIPGVPGASCGCCNACDSNFRPEDIAMGTLRMVSNNIAQIAYLNAMRYGLSRIYFGGHFIREHRYTMDTISYGVNFWSKGEMKALFLQHDGYLGALGCLLSGQNARYTGRRFSETE